ncbi:methyltransferase domain-containing protein [Actinocrispum sp. NPDC049592]|uniref:methyltransferase domain-containing protein n=1 Tax=Actinocrispum sp. NPDC049592 TaxID=3154835 RepID=UPI0034364D56
MTHTPEMFEAALTTWREWQDSPWGRLRFTLAEANLAKHIPPRSRILDLAGADGGDAIRLAAQGHDVTIVDFAPAMLAAAKQRADEAGVQITCVEADATDMPDADYDVVLCHNLLQYQADPSAALKSAVRSLRPNGILSAMAINRHASPLTTAVRELDLVGALDAVTATEADTQTFSAKITLYTAEEIAEVLEALGCEVRAHYGIRCVSDYITDDDRKREPQFYAELERLELALTGRHPYMHTARIFQLVASSR